MKAFIYTGGKIYPESITENPKKGDLVIAADSGYKNALLMGASVDIALGDFDSLGDSSCIASDIEKITVPCEKDETDTQLAVDLAVSRGADDIVIIGGLDGRIDHTISNLAILEAMFDIAIHCVITNGQNRARYIRSTSTLIAKSGFHYISLVASNEITKGVSVEGCKYPLKNAKLSRKFQYAISNEISANCALISVKKGGLYIIESKDII